MARLRDLKIGMKVQIVKGKEDPGCFYHTDAYKYVGKIGNITEIDNNDPHCAVKVDVNNAQIWWYPSSWIKIIKDEGETTMKQTKTTKITDPQKYILIDDDDISESFTDVTAKGIFGISNEAWAWDQYETSERIKEGKMKLFKIEEVKLEVTEPSIKIIG